MSTRVAVGWAILAVAAAATSAQAQGRPAPATSESAVVLSTQPVYTQGMQSLRDAAQKLRESIQELAQKPPGHERKLALDRAKAALHRTQQAMVDLPPSGRVVGTVASTAEYDASVRKLMQAADKLRDSVQEMAEQPAGDRRNQAIRDVNGALLDTQAAMANAYDLTAFPADRSVSISAAAMDCVRLERMWACQ